ncbi:hypothetical protein DL766_000641 [Monosporascus sp. MC13-8B]|uniref:Nascent polypeptide-associated complex subunit alpha-like UBA domain-containing protein n=1 Tax=Monosporascus cannonballus TaxID=155416 RepID=A0ABY0GQR0_9PEZI|nr:hypothetical protein DL762_010466 [Monosporascus cannonballus]RYO89913.1 hypothetical protein DL763_005469 [Monosporascus cannonballus]RYP39001.1 hypothetical protein DL766_000641 [Monosporascus sp. MC13-8B]
MAEPQPKTVREGATTATAGDAEDEVQTAAKSAEDRKAAAALASLDDARGDDAAAVDQEAASKAMRSLEGGAGAGAGAAEKKSKEAKKVKIEAADVALLVDELDLTKPKATELLKAHDGDAVKAMKAFIAV